MPAASAGGSEAPHPTWTGSLLRGAAVAALTVLPLAALWIALPRSETVRAVVAGLDLFSPYLVMDVAAVSLAVAAARDLRSAERRRGAPLGAVAGGATLGIAVALFALPLLHLWATARSVPHMIGGILPYSDAFNYYEGASSLLVTGELDAWSERRPLNSLLFAVRLAAAGGDLRLALLFQAALLAVAVVLAARAVAREVDAAAGLLLFAALYAVAREYVRTTLSEPLGLTLGTLAATTLWLGARRRQPGIFALGVGIMTVGLNARAGAFLALPVLVAWAGVATRRTGRRFSTSAAALALFACVAGFAVNGAWIRTYGSGAGVGHGNFWLTLYGFSTGRAGYRQIYSHHPLTTTLGEADLYRFARERALENVRERPLDLARGLLRGQVEALAGLWRFVRWVLSLVPGESAVNALFRIALATGVANWLWRSRRGPEAGLVVVATLATLLSAAFVYPEIGPRGLMVSYPLLFLGMALGAATWRASGSPGDPVPAAGAAPSIALALALVALASAGPGVAHLLLAPPPKAAPAPAAGADVAVVAIGPGSAALHVLPPGSAEPSVLPRIRDEDLEASLQQFPEHLAGARPGDRLRGPVLVLVAFDLGPRSHGMLWVLGPPEMRTEEWRTLQLTGRLRPSGWFRYFDVESFTPVGASPPV